MPKCIMLVGLPGVGKTTWLQDNLDILPPRTDTGYPPFVATSDFYIDESARLFGTTYSEIFPAVIGFAERAFKNDIATLAFNNFDFIVDRTNLHVKSRCEIMNRIKQYAGGFDENKEPYQFEAIVFQTPDDRTHMDRLASRHGKSISKEVMDKMKSIYTPPTNAEGFTNIRFVEI